MSFSESDPWNHLNVRIENETCYAECESCGWDGKRSGQIFNAHGQASMHELIFSWRDHLKKQHPHAIKCEAQVSMPGEPRPLSCALKMAHEGLHEFTVHWS